MRWWLPWLLMVASAATSAHELTEARIYVDVAPTGTVQIEYDVDLADLELAFGLDSDGDGSLTVAEFNAAQSTLIPAWRDAVTLAVDDRNCRLRDGTVQFRDYGAARYASLALSSDCVAPAQSLAIRSDFIFDVDPGHRAIVLFNGARGTTVRVADAGSRSHRFASAGAAAEDGNAVAFFKQGVHHILIGYDHLAFLCCLLISVAAARNGRASTRPLVTAVWVATAFTLAHSFTLSLAVFGIVTPASRPVEIAIAASVVLAAIHNLRPLARLSPAWFAFAFGLVHGFGFAGALGELGLPRGSELVALLCFNLGVEAGQMAAVAIALPLFMLLARRPRLGPVVFAVASVVIALLGTYWLQTRLFA